MTEVGFEVPPCPPQQVAKIFLPTSAEVKVYVEQEMLFEPLVTVTAALAHAVASGVL